MVVAVVVFLSLVSTSFLTQRNVTGVLGQASTLLLASLGCFVVLMGSIDVSVGAITLLMAAVAVKLLNAWDIGPSTLVAAMPFGAMLGGINGAIFVLGRSPSLAVTLGMLSIFTGLAWQILEGRGLRFTSSLFKELGIDHCVPNVPNICLFAIAAWLIMTFALWSLHVHRRRRRGGGDHRRPAGVRPYKIYGFALSGMMTELAGALAVAREGAAGPTLGKDLLLNTLAVIVVGGTSLSGGIGGVHRTLIRLLITALLRVSHQAGPRQAFGQQVTRTFGQWRTEALAAAQHRRR